MRRLGKNGKEQGVTRKLGEEVGEPVLGRSGEAARGDN